MPQQAAVPVLRSRSTYARLSPPLWDRRERQGRKRLAVSTADDRIARAVVLFLRNLLPPDAIGSIAPSPASCYFTQAIVLKDSCLRGASMLRHAFLTLVAVTAMAGSARGGVILSIDGAPTQYTPGTISSPNTFSFKIRLQNALGLNSFSIGMRLRAQNGNAVVGDDFKFSGASKNQPSTGYVFEGLSPLGFSSTTGISDDLSFSTLTVADSLSSGDDVDTVSGREFLAEVFVTTTSDVGALVLSFGAPLADSPVGSAIVLKNIGGNLIAGVEVPGTPELDRLEIIAIHPVLSSDSSSVPEPTSAVIWCLMGLGFAGAVRTRKRRSASD